MPRSPGPLQALQLQPPRHGNQHPCAMPACGPVVRRFRLWYSKYTYHVVKGFRMKPTTALLAGPVLLALIAASAQAQTPSSSGVKSPNSNPSNSSNRTVISVPRIAPRVPQPRADDPTFTHAALNEWKYVLTNSWTQLGYRGDKARLMASELSMADLAKIAETRVRIRHSSTGEISNALNKAISDKDIDLANRLLISAIIELGERKKS